MNIHQVKNPLTIIAIFAGIAEVSGTTVVTLLNPEQQAVFVWFLMIFPILLVILFFLTLNFNPKALYAPSDYQDEGNFMKINYNQTTQEKIIVPQSISSTHADLLSSSYTPQPKIGKTLVSVSNFEGAATFIRKLIGKGYSARIYRESRDQSISTFPAHTAIWLGERVSPLQAIPIIKLAKENYPHLKYIHLSGDGEVDPPDYVHDEIYIGGATTTAEEYSLRKIPDEDFLNLDPNMSTESLHNFVRSYY